MKEDQLWSCIPAVIKVYSNSRATVLPLVKAKFSDGSTLELPEIHDVPVITPCTAFAGLKLPVRVGDKVVLHICDRDIQHLLRVAKTEGLSQTEPSSPSLRRLHDMSDAVAYTGFFSDSASKPDTYDVWIFNNDDSDSMNHIRLKQNGDVEVRTNKATVTLEKEGTIQLKNDNATATFDASGEISLSNAVSSLVMDIAGTTTLTSPLQVTVDTAQLTCTGLIYALNGSVGLTSHTHGGVLSGPAYTASPTIPS